MDRKVSKKKITVACISSAAALTLVCAGAFALAPTGLRVSASAEETADCVKVFIGDVNRAPENYVQQRADYIEEVASAKASTDMDAVIGFDDYYTIDEVTALAEDYDVDIRNVYMWPQGDTGRLILHVENNDINATLKDYMTWVEENEFCKDDPQFAKNYQRLLDGEYEAFAMTATATADKLEALNAAECTNYVDVKYNAEAEAYAARAGKTVSYIELPTKPDGAL